MNKNREQSLKKLMYLIDRFAGLLKKILKFFVKK